MARLYKYKQSSEQSGYFLRGRSEDRNTTFQVSPLAERLFDQLDYEPGIVHERQGPRLPGRLQWALYEVGLISTGDGEESQTDEFEYTLDEDDVEVELTDEMVDTIASFIDSGSNRDAVEELGELLDVETQTSTPAAMWRLSESKAGGVEDYVREYLKACFNPQKESDWFVGVEYSQETFDEVRKGVLEINVQHWDEDDEKYLHILYFCPEHGFERIATACVSTVDWNKRSQLEQHRENIIEAVIDMADEVDVDIGQPTADIDLLTHEQRDFFD